MKNLTILLQTFILVIICNSIFAQGNWQRYGKRDWKMANQYSDMWWFFDMDRIVEDSEGNIWFGNNKFDGNRWNAMGPIPRKSFVYDVLSDSKGDLWISVLLEGVYRYSNGTWTQYKSEFGNRPWVQTLYEDSNGRVWLGACRGIYYFEDGKIHKSTNCGRLVTGITEDVHSNLWASTSSGVFKYDGNGWQIFSKFDAVDRNLCYSITTDTTGNIAVGHYNGRMSRKINDKWTVNQHGIPVFDWETSVPGFILGVLPGIVVGFTVKHKTAAILHYGADSKLWLASYFRGIYANDGSAWTDYKAVGSNHVMWRPIKFIEDSDKNLWVVSVRGVSKYNGAGWQHYKVNQIMGKRCIIVDAYFDKQDNLWVATNKGIGKLKKQ